MSAAHKPEDIFNVKRVRRLIALMKRHDLAEIDLKQADQRVRIKRGSDGAFQPSYAPPPPALPVALPPLRATPGNRAKPPRWW